MLNLIEKLTKVHTFLRKLAGKRLLKMVLEANYKMAGLTGNDQKILIHRNES